MKYKSSCLFVIRFPDINKSISPTGVTQQPWDRILDIKKVIFLGLTDTTMVMMMHIRTEQKYNKNIPQPSHTYLPTYLTRFYASSVHYRLKKGRPHKRNGKLDSLLI